MMHVHILPIPRRNITHVATRTHLMWKPKHATGTRRVIGKGGARTTLAVLEPARLQHVVRQTNSAHAAQQRRDGQRGGCCGVLNGGDLFCQHQNMFVLAGQGMCHDRLLSHGIADVVPGCACQWVGYVGQGSGVGVGIEGGPNHELCFVAPEARYPVNGFASGGRAAQQVHTIHNNTESGDHRIPFPPVILRRCEGEYGRECNDCHWVMKLQSRLGLCRCWARKQVLRVGRTDGIGA